MKCFVCEKNIDDKIDVYGTVTDRGCAHISCWHFPTKKIGVIKNEQIKEAK